MHIHILGICGTFMGGLAALAQAQGHRVSGSDRAVYPPMSTALEALGIDIHPGYEAGIEQIPADLYLVGNVMTRGMPVIESLLNSKARYSSGPQWLGETLLRKRRVYAVAGTHGKTTTASMLTWILHRSGVQPGYLIGGVPHHSEYSAQLGHSDHFVIEADEYDSAFFDKRSKFVHYHGDVVILNNLEFDHADIFPDLAAIQTQFHHLVRTVPSSGALIINGDDAHLAEVLQRGCWSNVVTFGRNAANDYRVQSHARSCDFSVFAGEQRVAEVRWRIAGAHNQLNALAAMLAAREAGLSWTDAASAVAEFKHSKRRMERLYDRDGVTVYDDFAHHPTAIRSTIDGLNSLSDRRVIAVCEPRSNSMRAGVHAAQLPAALASADAAHVMVYGETEWDAEAIRALQDAGVQIHATVSELLDTLMQQLCPGDQIIFMSNGPFDGAPAQLVQRL